MITESQALRLRSIARFASKAANEIDLANALGVSPQRAIAAVRTIRELVEAFPPARRPKEAKQTNGNKTI